MTLQEIAAVRPGRLAGIRRIEHDYRELRHLPLSAALKSFASASSSAGSAGKRALAHQIPAALIAVVSTE